MTNIQNKPIENEKLKAFMEKVREAIRKYKEKQAEQKKS
jgi:hypothetical protein